MKKIPCQRVVFYSKNDLNASRHFSNALKIIQKINLEANFNVNEIIELYQIKLYFDNGFSSTKWSTSERASFEDVVNKFWDIISDFWIKIEDSNVLGFYMELESEFYDSFWKLINNFKTYKKINSSTFESILAYKKFYIRQALKNENIVKYFSKEIKSYLLVKSDSAEVILNSFEAAETTPSDKLFFPKITQAEYESIFSLYLESLNVNLNYVRLIESAVNIKISDRIKLNAKKVSDRLNAEIFEKGSSWTQGIQVTISKDQKEPITKTFDPAQNRINCSYSYDFLEANLNPISILTVFKKMFSYLNFQGCIDLVSKSSEADTLELIFMRSKNDYLDTAKFHEKNILSQAQLFIYRHFLKEHKITIEDTLSHIVNEYLNDEFEIKGIRMTFPSVEISPLERIRFLIPEFDFLIKQYNSFVEDGFIDFELIQFSTAPLNFSQVKSKFERKYCYGTGEEFNQLKHSFFSNQSMLHYIPRFESKYENLFNLLELEDILYSEFKDYQKSGIDFLISKSYLEINNDGVVKIKNKYSIMIIGFLYKEDVISYWHYPEAIRDEMLILEEKGFLKFEGTLFNKEERKYLNFFLNKKEFSNGLELRNKYLHGTNSMSSREQENDYDILLKIVILVILKIQEELAIYKAINKRA